MTEVSERIPVDEPGNRAPLMVLAWIWVLAPFGYGVYELVAKIPALFGS
ncbi:MAG: MFS transporter small subunit [Pseudonocardiaceae bacterium]